MGRNTERSRHAHITFQFCFLRSTTPNRQQQTPWHQKKLGFENIQPFTQTSILVCFLTCVAIAVMAIQQMTPISFSVAVIADLTLYSFIPDTYQKTVLKYALFITAGLLIIRVQQGKMSSTICVTDVRSNPNSPPYRTFGTFLT
jgi:hypothetical protein